MKRILLVDGAIDFLKILAQAFEQDLEVHTATGVSSGKDSGFEIEMAKYYGAIFIPKASYDFLMEIKKYR